MRISKHEASVENRSVGKRTATICLISGLIVTAFAAPSCLATDACLRFSDCAQGLTCYNSICVIAPAQTDDEGGADEAGTDTDSSTTTFTDSGTPLVDSSVSDSAADDSGDASDDAADASDD